MKLFPLLLLLVACGPTTEARPIPGRPAPASDDPVDTGGVSQPAGTDPEPATGSNDGPQISRSRGKEGGVVVFWPRIIPASEDAAMKDLAGKLQKELVAIARGRKGGGDVDVRPEPERVCPQSGCHAATLGVLLAHGGGGCTALALVSRPGVSPTRIVPWAGVVKLKQEEVPFRKYPESQVVIQDAVPCEELLASLAEHRADVVAALEAAD